MILMDDPYATDQLEETAVQTEKKSTVARLLAGVVAHAANISRCISKLNSESWAKPDDQRDPRHQLEHKVVKQNFLPGEIVNNLLKFLEERAPSSSRRETCLPWLEKHLAYGAPPKDQIMGRVDAEDLQQELPGAGIRNNKLQQVFMKPS